MTKPWTDLSATTQTRFLLNNGLNCLLPKRLILNPLKLTTNNIVVVFVTKLQQTDDRFLTLPYPKSLLELSLKIKSSTCVHTVWGVIWVIWGHRDGDKVASHATLALRPLSVARQSPP